MSSSDKNLSDLNYSIQEECSELRIAIVRSEWNDEITDRLMKGSLEGLHKFGVTDKHIRIIEVPGSFELPLGAQMLLEECDPLPSAVICLGCVIRGETSHFEYVSQSVAQGIKDVGLKYNVPVIFGVLTDDNKEQSLSRSGGSLGNKGEEAAVTAVRMALLQRKIRR
jgi:6,7-dimethyl-8-ribityllumazine synthase